MLNFYYDFSLDIEKKSILICVDQKYEFELIFPEHSNFDPKIEYLDSGEYKLTFKKIFRGIDILYFLKSSSIKEEIVVYDKKSCKDFYLKFKIKNCLIFYDKKEICYKVLGKNKIEIFNFSKLKINYMQHNKNTNLDNFCTLDVDIINSELGYKFNSKDCEDSCFPISIDPTFNFKTKINKINNNYSNNDLDRHNYMIVSGQSIADDFFDSAVGLASESGVIGSTPNHYTPYSPPGSVFYKKVLISDDVIFERGCRLLFPYLTDLMDEVNVVVNQDGVDTAIGTLPIKSTFVNNIRYDYVDFDFKFNFFSQIKISALVKLDPQRYGDFSVLYDRNLTFLPQINMYINNKNFITINNDYSFNSSITCSSLDSFKPKRFDIIPFETSLLNKEKNKTKTFRSVAFDVDSTSFMTNYSFTFPNIDFSNWPKVRSFEEKNTDSFLAKRGSSNSFFNNVEVIYTSAINNRNNVEENTEFKKSYNYIDPEDMYFDINQEQANVSNGRISLNTENFQLLTYQKPTHYIICKNMKKIKDIEYFNVVFSSKNNETKFVFENHEFFKFEFAENSFPFVEKKINVLLDNNSIKEVSPIELKENCLNGYYAIFRNKNKIFKYKVIKSGRDFVSFEKNISDIIKNSDYIGFFPYIPDEITFVYSHISYDVLRKNLMINGVVDGTGDISYKPLELNVLQGSPTEILSNFRERDGDFGGITKKISIREQSLFYYFGFNISSVGVKPSVELTENTDIKNINPKKLSIKSGGIAFSNISVPTKYKNRILYLEVDAPGFADKVSIDVYNKDGDFVKYTGNVEGITEFVFGDLDENRFVEIRINQSNLEYSKIIINFINI